MYRYTKEKMEQFLLLHSHRRMEYTISKDIIISLSLKKDNNKKNFTTKTLIS